MESRLTTLQSDYKHLQDSYDNLERDHQADIEELRSRCTAAEKEKANLSSDLKSVERALRQQIEELQSSLDQSELQLAKREKYLQVFGDLCS